MSCAKEENSLAPIFDDEPVLNVDPKGNEAYLTGDSDYIFDENALHTFELLINNYNLSKLNNDPTAEEYVEGGLVFEGDTISPVGIRYKGSIGAFVGCVSGNDWTNPSGIKTCTKLSMKVKINWEGREERFYDLKKVQLHSMNQDVSQMRDRLGYYLFRSMGVPSPRATHARLMINGKYGGLFSLVEQIDGRFTRQHFDDGKGNLYKEVWPLNDRNQGASKSAFLSALKTNEDENPLVDIIYNFGQEMALATEENEAKILEKYLNIDEALSYWVVDRAIRHDDGPSHFYCNGQSCSNHNYYWYEETDKEKLSLVPWDMDNAFENIIRNTNPVTPVADEWGQTTNNCQSFLFGSFGLRQKSAACDKIIGGLSKFETQFDAIKEILISGPLAKTAVDVKIDQWALQIRQATSEAAGLHDDAISVAQWEDGIEKLKTQLDYARK